MSDFTKNIANSLDNSLNFENCSIFTKYDFEDTASALGSAFGLCDQRNYIIEELVPYLKENAEMRAFSEDEIKNFEYRPMALSVYYYNVIDYWWIILAVNGYFNPREFHSFKTLIIPVKSDIETVLNRELFANSKVGAIPT